MQWQDVRSHYPDRWLLVEAIKAHSEDDKRMLAKEYREDMERRRSN